MERTVITRNDVEEMLKENKALKINEFWQFRSLLDDFQKDMAVIYLIERLSSEGKTSSEIWNLLSQEEDQYHPPKTQGENDG